jgi:calcium-dependent protein kinase
MYLLLTGEAPFQGDTEEEIFKKIKKCKYDLNLPKFNEVSDNCKDLIKKLIEPDINKRIKASEALKHPFFIEEFNANKALTENKDLSVLETLVNIKPLPSKFHEAITAFLCVNYISKDEEKRLREVFRYIDKENQNSLSSTTIDNCLKENGYLISKDKLNYIIKSLDSDSNGTIEYQEFLRGVCDKDSLFDNNNLKNAFDCIDEGMKGYINSNDIKRFIFQEKGITDILFKEYLEQFGMNINDKLTYDDFAFIIKNNEKLRKNN